jgi:uncharacterized membrane protein YcfT
MPVIRLRADTAVWEDFTTATNGQHAEITRQFWAWYVRRPGAKLPRRPA